MTTTTLEEEAFALAEGFIRHTAAGGRFYGTSALSERDKALIKLGILAMANPDAFQRVVANEHDGVVTEYLFHISGDGVAGGEIEVTRPIGQFGYQGWKAFFRYGDGRRAVYAVEGVARLRDGGTTSMRGEFGEIFSPSPMNRQASSPFWLTDDEKIELTTLHVLRH